MPFFKYISILSFFSDVTGVGTLGGSLSLFTNFGRVEKVVLKDTMGKACRFYPTPF